MTEPGRKYKVWEPLLLGLMAVVGMLAGAKFANTGAPHEHSKVGYTSAHYNGRQVEEIIRFIETKYVGDVSTDELVDKAINAVLENLDPHTHYIPADEVEALHERTSGNYVGIGIEVAFIEDTLVILFPKPNSPAEKSGLRPGDHIIAVDGRSIVLDSIDKGEILGLIKGAKGTNVQLTIKPMLEAKTHVVDIVRDRIKVPSVIAGYMLDSTTAYIKIHRFTSTTYREFMDHWERMATEDQAKDLILDLRDNPGGYLSEAVNILSQIFVEEGQLLLFTQGENQKRNEYKSTGKIFFTIGKVIVLINEGSASASEIIAGCLQDQDRGLIIGSSTYGKGLVQEQYTLSNGGVLRMTVSKYYTPSGRSIQKSYDSTYVADTNAVFRTAKGRLVYAGGGITPDIVIDDKINWSHPLLREWMDIVSTYAIHYNLIHHDGKIVSMDQFEKVKQEIPSDSIIFEKLFDMASKRPSPKGDSLSQYLVEKRENLMRIANATLIAYRVGEEGWYKGFNETDSTIIKARHYIGMKLEDVLEIE